MMGQGLKFSFVLLCLLGTGGCSSTESAPDPNASVSSFCENWGKAACSPKVVLACSGEAKVDADLTDACVTRQQAFCKGLLPTNGYSSQNASQCLSAVQAAYSDAQLDPDDVAIVRHRGEPCNHLIKGTQGKGESCVSDDECDTVHNYLCVLKSGVGSCQIPALVEGGDPCAAPDAACKSGYYCGLDEACVKSKDANRECAASFECGTGLECDANTGKCVVRVNAESCTQDDDCTDNRVCDIPFRASTGRCLPIIILSASTSICEDLQ